MKSRLIPIVLVLAGALCPAGLKAQVTAAQPSSKTPSAEIDRSKGPCALARPVPTRALYLFLFANQVVVEQAAARDEARGKDGSSWRNRYWREAGLTDDQGASLSAVALDWRKQQDVIEAQIKAIEDERKAQPNPPKNLLTVAEFGKFGKEGNDLLDDEIAELKSLLGDESFAKLDAFVKARYSPPAGALPDGCPKAGQQQTPQDSGGKP